LRFGARGRIHVQKDIAKHYVEVSKGLGKCIKKEGMSKTPLKVPFHANLCKLDNL
jgi:hypothetical protein